MKFIGLSMRTSPSTEMNSVGSCGIPTLKGFISEEFLAGLRPKAPV